MARLRDGSMVTLWPRVAAVSHPDVDTVWLAPDFLASLVGFAHGHDPDPALLEAMGAHIDDGEPDRQDATLLARLAELDQTYTGWIPGLWQGARERIENTEAMLSRRRVFPLVRAARPTLPASTALRARVLESFTPQRIYIEDDIDGLSILMARGCEVETWEPDDSRRAWLADQAERVGVVATLSESTPAGEGLFDLTVIHAGPPAEMRAALERALTVTRPGGHICICVRSPWEWTLFAQIEAGAFSVVRYDREIDHWLLPNGLVVDGAGDLVVLERPEEATLPTVADNPAERVRAQPYTTVDLDSLDEDQLDKEAIERFADTIAAQSAHPEAFRSIQRDGERDLLCWYDETGNGISAELRRNEEHLLVTLMPFDRQLEYAVVCAAYGTFADPYTRARPLRTRRWHEESIFA